MAAFYPIQRAQRPHKCYYIFTNSMDNSLWLSCIHEATQFSLYSLSALYLPLGYSFVLRQRSLMVVFEMISLL